MKLFLKKLQDTPKDEIDNYQYIGAEHVILTCAQLRILRRHTDALRLFEKFEKEIILSEYELAGLTTIIEICKEHSYVTKIIKYVKRLKSLCPNHPYVIELGKQYSIH